MERQRHAFNIPNRLDEPIYPSATPEIRSQKLATIPMALVREKR